MGLSGFRIATIRGIAIRIHFTFLIILPFLAFAFTQAFRVAARLADVPPEQLSGTPWLWGLGVALALFASVLVHELAHSLYAIRTGGKVRDITLLMIGGVSQLSEPPKAARDEAGMALVGPAVSLLLGGIFQLLHVVAQNVSFNLRFALFYLGSLNLFLGFFNLLPAFPMDGGRIVRALLSTRVGPVRATYISAALGKLFAVLFGVWGLFTFNTVLLLIAFFVYVGAQGEQQGVVMKALLGRLHVLDVMSRNVVTIPAAFSVADAAERMLGERQVVFVTPLEAGNVGIVTSDAILRLPAEERATRLVEDIATRLPPLSPVDEAEAALKLMAEREAEMLAVMENGELVGTVSREDIVRGLKLSQLDAAQHPTDRWLPPWQRQIPT